MSETISEENIQKRVLVLGSTQHSRFVDSYAWDTIPEGLDVADYETVILNLAPLNDVEFAHSVKSGRLPAYSKFARLLLSRGSEVIVIGMPRHQTIGVQGNMQIYWWLPVMPNIEFSSGQEIENINPDFEYYFKHVKRWVFHSTPYQREISPSLAGYIQLVYPQASDFRASINPIAETRFHHAIAFEIRYHARANNAQGNIDSGSIIWLPEPTEISHSEAVDLLLRERYRIGFEQMRPSWIDKYKLPQQLPIETDIEEREREIQRQTVLLVEAKQCLEKETRFQKLLYEKGEDILEPIARDALRVLGAHVDDPQQRGREDGRLVDPKGRNGILEIKGHIGPLKQKDIRELRTWVDNAIADEDWLGKGILIANLFCEASPDQRSNVYHPDCIRLADRYEFCLMTTTQLFRAVCSHQKGELDIEAFWDSVFDSKGECILPELDS